MHLSFFSQYTCVLGLGGVALWAHAQAPTPQAPPPVVAPTSTPASTPDQGVPFWPYVSPLAGYRRYIEAPVQDWNAANQTVRQVGGWRADAPPVAPGADAHRQGWPEPVPTAPSSGAHSGHRP